jgi:hypothetical protein
MPLARIVTWLAEDTDALAKDLRARGFEVVTKSPDEISSEPADLEITVDECASEDALTSASGIALAQDKCVFIAPGAIVESFRPVPAIRPPVMIREPEPELAYDSVQSPESDELEPLAAIHQLEDQQQTQPQIPVLESAESAIDFSTAVAEPEVSELALEAVSDPLLAAPLAEELTEPLAEVTEPFAEAGEEDLVAQEISASVEYLPPPIIEPVDEVTLAAAEIDSEEYSKAQPDALVGVPAFAQVEAVSPLETEATSQTQLETVVEATPVPNVEEVWLLETEAVSEVQPEAIVDIPSEAPTILQADVSLIETEPTSDWPIWHPLAEAEIPAQDAVAELLVKEPAFAVPVTSRSKTVFQQQVPQVVPLMQNAVPVRPNTYRQRILQKRVVQNDEAFWKTATILAMVAVAALLVGASANRFSPLPADLVQRSIEAQQPVPFEKARTVPTLPLEAGNKIGATELPAAHGSDVARFHPALAVEPALSRMIPESAPNRTNDRLIRVKPQRPSAGHSESDMVAEDTVVRYGKKHPPASHTQAQKNSGVKQYSDLD